MLAAHLTGGSRLYHDETDFYQEFKAFSTRLVLRLFLGLDDPDEVEEVASIATSHWHGIISVPLNVRYISFKNPYLSIFSVAGHIKIYSCQTLHQM